MGKLTLLELCAQVLGLIFMVVWALIHPSIWALVVGMVFSHVIKVIASHLLFPKPPMRFTFDRSAASELFNFGKWVFLATMLGFVVQRGDTIVLGKFMTMRQLGAYSIAFTLASAALEATRAIAHKVLYPFYSKMMRVDLGKLREQTASIRRPLTAMMLPPLWILVVLGPELIGFLYDDRYIAAGWMVQIVAAGMILSVIIAPIELVILASGDSRRHLFNLVCRSLAMLPAVVLGGWLWGMVGIIVGMAVAPLLYYPMMAILIRRYNLWMPWFDLVWMMASAVVIGSGFAVKGLF
jgi:O-antigen/teichoic acid export membrane protein